MALRRLKSALNTKSAIRLKADIRRSLNKEDADSTKIEFGIGGCESGI